MTGYVVLCERAPTNYYPLIHTRQVGYPFQKRLYRKSFLYEAINRNKQFEKWFVDIVNFVDIDNNDKNDISIFSLSFVTTTHGRPTAGSREIQQVYPKLKGIEFVKKQIPKNPQEIYQ